MRHSQKVHDAMQKVFDKLLALSPQELAERLEKRELGPIGRLMRETGTVDELCEQVSYSGYSSVDVNDITEQEIGEYIIVTPEEEWLKAA